MRSVIPATCPAPEIAAVPARSALQARLADYLELTKPRIALLALITVAMGFGLASAGNWELIPLVHALFGITLVAASSSAFNQLFEVDTDARMRRTQNRPLPAGRMGPGEVILFGLVTGICGVAYLACFVNALTAALGVLTLVLYAGVYTPLKRKTGLNTVVGAIPGALPPVLGWTAAGGSLDMGAFSLFAILFLWQFPHFMAIAWIYREEYARAGLKMLPIEDTRHLTTGYLAVAYALALIPVSLLPNQVGLAGHGYSLAALFLGGGYLWSSIKFLRNQSVPTARSLLWTSIAHLPLLLGALVSDHYWLLK